MALGAACPGASVIPTTGAGAGVGLSTGAEVVACSLGAGDVAGELDVVVVEEVVDVVAEVEVVPALSPDPQDGRSPDARSAARQRWARFMRGPFGRKSTPGGAVGA